MAKKSKSDQLLICSYGLFWKAEDVFWGKPRKIGRLLGVNAKARLSMPVDFREQIGIYILYADYRIIYIGQAGNGYKNLFERLRHHRVFDELSGRWNQFSWFGLKWVKKNNELSTATDAVHPAKDTLLNHIEAILIHACEPPLNRQGGRWGKEVERYLQYRDTRNLGASIGEMINEIHKKISANNE